MSGSTAYVGRDALLKSSANGGSTFTVVGGVRTTNFQIGNNPVDITNVSSGGFQEMLANGGTQAISCSVDGVVVDNTAFETMLASAKDRTLIFYRMDFANGGSIITRFAVGDMTIQGGHDQAQTFQATLASSGTITWTNPT
jgi:predicted secreted protein